ncbi:Pycsar system effector family protein [Sphingosinicella rhizophila]|uniref:DUF5706 domain-containing protein n=1 Tax=Sphingosinicella rhizophila TaxID=3050082 RepID=A0ABU3Q598_9SPHN|nr:Pycsar system effector family protein [Sphingosinicella sp. GR2756]MDT9598575.1 DUF5706 domain-containing protein [Sphingosinicella sp. GR2756]
MASRDRRANVRGGNRATKMEGGKEVPRSEYSPDAVHLMRTIQHAHVQLSAMADQKANLLMAATFAIFTVAIGQARNASMPLPLLILGGAAFFAALCTILAVDPAFKGSKKAKDRDNLLFFGTFAHLEEEDYVARMHEILRHDREIFDSMARNIYQNGRVLARKKYFWLGYAYRIFLAGLVASATAFCLIYLGHMR